VSRSRGHYTPLADWHEYDVRIAKILEGQMEVEAWRLRERGLRLIAAANHLSFRNIAMDSDNGTASTLVQRGEDWPLQHIQPTAGIYSFFATLAQAARRAPEQALVWWETGATCERRDRVGEQWHNLRPDALAEYRVGQSRICFWLEWDRGTMNVRDLAVKFRSYAYYLASREWARERTALPRLFAVAPEVPQERRIQRVAHSSLSSITWLDIWTTTEVWLHEHGPLAPIWSPGLPQPGHPAQPAALPRHCAFEMNSLKKK
jgi:Replication-relaxation